MASRVFYVSLLTAPFNTRSNGFCHRILIHTARSGLHGMLKARIGEFSRNRESRGAVRCGFQIYMGNLSVRFGAVFSCHESCSVVRLNFMSYGAVRCRNLTLSPVAWWVLRVPININFVGSIITECMLVGAFLDD